MSFEEPEVLKNMTVTTTVKVKPKKQYNNLFLGRGTINVVICMLAITGINRGISITHSFKRYLFKIYTIIWPFIIFINAIVHIIYSYKYNITQNTIRTAIVIISYLNISISALLSHTKLENIYTKLNKLSYKLKLICKFKQNDLKIVLLTMFTVICELQVLVLYFMNKFHRMNSLVRNLSAIMSWYFFSVSNFEYIWRYALFNLIRINLNAIYETLKQLHKSVNDNENLEFSTKKATIRYGLKAKSINNNLEKQLCDVKKNYLENVEIQKRIISILNPLVSLHQIIIYVK